MQLLQTHPAGHSSRPLSGYDKCTMAEDIRRLVRDHLAIEGPIALVDHDIGLMVAYAYARAYRDDVSHLAVIDAPLPGTTVFDKLRVDPRVWQFAFHSVRDIPEMLVSGRERAYLQAFFDGDVRIMRRAMRDRCDRNLLAPVGARIRMINRKYNGARPILPPLGLPSLLFFFPEVRV